MSRNAAPSDAHAARGAQIKQLEVRRDKRHDAVGLVPRQQGAPDGRALRDSSFVPAPARTCHSGVARHPTRKPKDAPGGSPGAQKDFKTKIVLAPK